MPIHKDTRTLMKLAKDQGFEVETSRNGHIKIKDKDGRLVTTLSGTPSGTRDRQNSLAQLRRAGINVPR